MDSASTGDAYTDAEAGVAQSTALRAAEVADEGESRGGEAGEVGARGISKERLEKRLEERLEEGERRKGRIEAGEEKVEGSDVASVVGERAGDEDTEGGSTANERQAAADDEAIKNEAKESGASEITAGMFVRKSKQEKRAAREAQIKRARTEGRRVKNKMQRLEKQQARRSFLSTMTDEERKAYVERERAEREAEEKARAAALELWKTEGKLKVVILLDMLAGMNAKERHSLAKQIGYAQHTMSKNFERYSVSLTIAPFDPASDFAALTEMFGSKRWTMNFCRDFPDQGVCAANESGKDGDRKPVVVLSPDAEQAFTENDALFADDKVTFVIGGIVDRTVTSRQSITWAYEKGFEARKLPLHLVPAVRHRILNVNTVFDILCAVKFGDSWASAFEKFVPFRKREEGTGKAVTSQVDCADDGDEKRQENERISGDSDTELANAANPFLE